MKRLQHGIFPIKQDWKAERIGDGEWPLAIETSRILDSKKDERSRRRRSFSFLLFSCSTSWYKYHKIIGVSDIPSWENNVAPSFGTTAMMCFQFRFQAIHAFGLYFERFSRHKREMKNSSLFSSLVSLCRLDWNSEKTNKPLPIFENLEWTTMAFFKMCSIFMYYTWFRKRDLGVLSQPRHSSPTQQAWFCGNS